MRAIIASTVAIAALLAVAPAQAAPPTLDPLAVKFDATERSVTATWTLAAGTTTYLVEAASAPDTTASGEFVQANVVGSALLPAVTVKKFEPGPGPVWVHVAAYNASDL